MDKWLIAGSSDKVIKKLGVEDFENLHLRRVTVFFENANFLITKYSPLSNGVYLILELSNGVELHFEGANCGYGGGGPHATIEILKKFGCFEEGLEDLVFGHDAVSFVVMDDHIVWNTVDTTYLFYPQIRANSKDKSLNNKICKNQNVDVDLEKRKVMIYNPQRNCWNGMMNLLSYMEDIEFEYYIGSNSFLEGGAHLDEKKAREMFYKYGNADIKGVTHVNLVVTGSNFSVACWIDRRDEMAVMEAVYLSLTGERLFGDFGFGVTLWDVCKTGWHLLRSRNHEIYEKKLIEKKVLGREWRR